MIIKRQKTAPMAEQEKEKVREFRWDYLIELKKFGARTWQ